MMSYFNIYDAIPICRTHARTEPVRAHKFSSDNASDKRQFCRLRCRSLHTLSYVYFYTSLSTMNLLFAECYYIYIGI